MKETPKVEIKDKILLTVEEAAAYSGISKTTLRGRLREGEYDFILKNGERLPIFKSQRRQIIQTYANYVFDYVNGGTMS